MEIMRTHARIGYDLLRGQGEYEPEILEVVLRHHELLDGSGYPDGFAGAQINDLVRLVTICDDLPAMIAVAVDAGGADLGPREVAVGAALAAAQGIQALLFGPAAEIGSTPDGVEVIDAPVSIAKAADPAYAVRSTPEASIVQAARAVAQGRAQALVSGGSTGSALAAGLFNLRRDRGIYRPALALPVPIPGVRPCCSTSARTSPAVPSTSSSSRTWAPRSRKP